MNDSMSGFNISEILKNTSEENKISCSRVFEISNNYSVFPDIIGISLNQNDIRISNCQLGLFGFGEKKKIVQPAESVTSDLEHSIYEYIEDDKLPCAAAWNIANELKINKIDVASACEKMKIKISKCQLGAF